MKALVSGANGFVGRALLRAAASGGVQAEGLVRRAAQRCEGTTATDYSPGAIAALIDARTPDVFVHAAGSASVAASMADPAGDFESSVHLYRDVLEGVRLSARKPRLVFLSSAAVYGNPQRLPVAEGDSRSPISPYGRHKVLCELLSEAYSACFGIPVLLVRAFSLFGAEQKRLVVWELFRQFQDAGEVVLAGTGEEERDYLHVDDFALAVWLCARAVAIPCEVVNIASGHSTRIRDLAEGIGMLKGARKEVKCRGRLIPGDPTVWRADISRMRALVGDVPRPGFAERLRQVIAAWSR